MTYHFTTKVSDPFDQAVERVTAVLKDAGFGILTTIDVQATMKKKIDADINPYTILGACNPDFALKAIQAESKIGTMLPCNVIVQQLDNGDVEVSAVDPMASMQAIQNPALGEIATEVQTLMKGVIDKL